MLVYQTQKNTKIFFTFLLLTLHLFSYSKDKQLDSLKYYKKELLNSDTLSIDTVLYLYKKAKEFANIPEEILLIRFEAEYLSFQGLKDITYLKCNRALELAQKNELRVFEGLVYLDLSNYYYTFHQYKLAYQTILKSKIILENLTPEDIVLYNSTQKEKLTKEEMLDPLIYNIGVMALDNGEYEKAEKHYEESLRFSLKRNNKQGVLDAKINLANLLLEKQENKKSNVAFFELLKDSIQLQSDLVIIYYNISANFLELGKRKKSLKYIDMALNVNNEVGNELLLVDLFFLKAKILKKLGNYKVAKTLLNKSVEKSMKIDDFLFLIDIYNELAEIEMKDNNPQKANYYYKELLSVQDSLKKREELGSYEEILLQNKLYHQEQLNIEQQLIIKNEKERSNLYLWLTVLSFFLLMALGFNFYISSKNNHKRLLLVKQRAKINEIEIENKRKDEAIKSQEIQNELKVKKEELLLSLLYIKKRKEKTKVIQNEIDKIKDKSIITKTDLLNLKGFINKKSKDLDIEENIQQKINSTQKDFFTNIQTSYPTLTKTDLKILAYLRVDINTKEIANMQNVSIDAIRKTRHRIRKKLDLSPKQSLERFIINYY